MGVARRSGGRTSGSSAVHRGTTRNDHAPVVLGERSYETCPGAVGHAARRRFAHASAHTLVGHECADAAT